MKRRVLWILVTSLVLLFSGCAPAKQSLVEGVEKGCAQEINSYCKEVTPGQARVLACLYAYSDKLSGQCEYALTDAAMQLEQALMTLSYLVNECRADMETYCSDINPGEGRLLQCLDKNDAKISERCKKALTETVGPAETAKEPAAAQAGSY